MIAFDVFVTVPVAAREAVVIAAPDLHKADAAFQQASCDQALASKVFGFFGNVDCGWILAAGILQTVHLQDVLRLAGNVEGFRCTELHLRGQFVRANPSIQSRVTRPLLVEAAIQLIQ